MIKAFTDLFAAKNPENFAEALFEGQYSFYIYPKVEGRLPYHTSSLQILCYTDEDRRTPIEFRCKWFRVKGDGTYPLHTTKQKSALDTDPLINRKNNTYNITPYDIGYRIQVLVKSESRFNSGVAFVTFPMIILDPVLKPALESSFISC